MRRFDQLLEDTHKRTNHNCGGQLNAYNAFSYRENTHTHTQREREREAAVCVFGFTLVVYYIFILRWNGRCTAAVPPAAAHLLSLIAPSVLCVDSLHTP